MKSEKLISFLSEKKKLLIVGILLVLGLNIALFSHIASVKKAEQVRIALEKAEADKKAADSLAVVEKKQEAESIVRQKKQAIEDVKQKRVAEWLDSLKIPELEGIWANNDSVKLVDSITDNLSQKLFIELVDNGEDKRGSVDVGYYQKVDPLLNYFYYDEAKGILSPKLKLVKTYDSLMGVDFYMSVVKSQSGSFVIGTNTSTTFTPYKCARDIKISESLRNEIKSHIVPNDIESSLEEIECIGSQGYISRFIVRLTVSSYESYLYPFVVDYNISTKKAVVQFSMYQHDVESYARFSSDGRANIISFTDYGIAGFYCLRNGKWEKHFYSVPLM